VTTTSTASAAPSSTSPATHHLLIDRHVIVALEGADAVGKSAHCARLVDHLKGLCPVGLASFEHPAPPRPSATLVERAVWYATRRAILGESVVGSQTPMLVVSNRWWWSTTMLGCFQPEAVPIAEAEEAAWKATPAVPVVTVLLDAPDDVLDARIAARAREGLASSIDADARQPTLRLAYRAAAGLGGWPVVQTEGDFEAAALRVLRAVIAALITAGHARLVALPAAPFAPPRWRPRGERTRLAAPAVQRASGMKPYIGITGVVTPGDVATIRACVPLVPPSHRLMAGILVSAKTLVGGATTSRRYPDASRVESLLAACADAGAWPVVHYNSRAEEGVFGVELAMLRERFPSMRGLQLNVTNPQPFPVEAFARQNRGVELILQVNRAAMPSLASTRAGDTYDRHCARCLVADEVSAYAARYYGVAHLLLDASAGEGVPLDHDLAGTVIGRNGDEWRDRGRRVGIAGRLGPDSADALASVAMALKVAAANRVLCTDGADRFEVTLADLSYDSETGVRSPVADPTPGEQHQDALDNAKARAWVALAARAVRGESIV